MFENSVGESFVRSSDAFWEATAHRLATSMPSMSGHSRAIAGLWPLGYHVPKEFTASPDPGFGNPRWFLSGNSISLDAAIDKTR
jgi:hypothetical protein